MAKRRQINGKWYRQRRGKWVEIPAEWVGQTTHPQSIRKRQSKQVRKIRMNVDNFRQPNRLAVKKIRKDGYFTKRKMAHPENRTPRHRGTKANKIEF